MKTETFSFTDFHLKVYGDCFNNFPILELRQCVMISSALGLSRPSAHSSV